MVNRKMTAILTYPPTKTSHDSCSVRFIIKLALVILTALLLAGCAKPRPNNTENICQIFEQYPDWYHDAKRCEQKWGVPVPIQMSIINQESSFNAKAQPPRKKILWIIPGKRPSTAYGYSQALTSTWSQYQREHRSGANRTNFTHATDFVGWYASQANKRTSISPTDPYRLYLAYHEGAGGYARQTHLTKPWLIRAAQKVKVRAEMYQRQLNSCEQYIAKPKGWW
ncbi:MAG: transcriptional regulator [Gammaproteobacteria bacterium]|jgi:hypothetical protein|nr:transcriptional regulator [Gammaproteobacteria bacterium]